ncbi:hypothetical protein EC957_004864 [Mortierella hygrophila]|uniref:Uncharacterized protein n=1 Tax=Mortierella hygrophila TaxID=979708 RepID=A0A9P6F050_9FUNG|nr:hypothetical protein EC957_004864 [Mortierella hygrophila]
MNLAGPFPKQSAQGKVELADDLASTKSDATRRLYSTRASGSRWLGEVYEVKLAAFEAAKNLYRTWVVDQDREQMTRSYLDRDGI